MLKNEKAIKHFLDMLDWGGHIEMGDNDREWLAEQINVFLNPPNDKSRCDNCGDLQTIVIASSLGKLCHECIESLFEQAETMREDMEGE